MSSDHQEPRGFEPPRVIDELHRQPPSSTTGNILPDFTALHLPRTPSPLSSAVEMITPESPVPASLGGGILTNPSTSFHDAVTATTTVKTHNPLRLSDTNSSSTIATTPPKVPTSARRTTILRRSHFDPINTDCEEPQKNKTVKTQPPRIPSPPKSRICLFISIVIN
ncbi:hypothetical protein L1887_40025 [Cichorium endivia]|nr:hypothetical protein L1887_40025 [Cichorium endivia]